jgi:hypothetical protein
MKFIEVLLESGDMATLNTNSITIVTRRRYGGCSIGMTNNLKVSSRTSYKEIAEKLTGLNLGKTEQKQNKPNRHTTLEEEKARQRKLLVSIYGEEEVKTIEELAEARAEELFRMLKKDIKEFNKKC